MRFGSLELFIIPGGRFRLDGGAVFGVVPRVLWERSFPADAQNRVSLAANCPLVCGPGFNALIESGVGDKWDARARKTYAIENRSHLAEELATRGVSAEEVDALILSRLQFDHAGGATRRGADGCVPAPMRRSTSRRLSSPTPGVPGKANALDTFPRIGSPTRRLAGSKRFPARRRSGRDSR
jgi:glyoxylase-like metal-dependent hydrolase (beta-lactamase superfamily II)